MQPLLGKQFSVPDGVNGMNELGDFEQVLLDAVSSHVWLRPRSGSGRFWILDFERGVSVSELGENRRCPNWHGRRQFGWEESGREMDGL